eukprot:s56_g44.t1
MAIFSRAGEIRTTVSESRLQEALHCKASKAASRILERAEVVLVDSAEESRKLEEECSRERWMRAAKEALLPAALQAPLALLSPWSGLAGVSIAAMPPMPAAMLPPGLQEEEPFAALIFPGFDSSAFIWQITCWQIHHIPCIDSVCPACGQRSAHKGATGVMGVVHSAYNYVFPPDPVEIYNPGLEDRISHANDAVESAFQDMSETFAAMKSLMRKTQSDWDTYSKPLAKSCQGIRKELVRLAHASPVAQGEERILPLLFKKRAKTGGDIEGCARGDLPFAMVPSNCQCIAGNEAKGCDSEVDSDHVLRCSHLRRRILPAMKLDQLYEGDGDCNISKEASFNKPLLQDEEPRDFQVHASMPGLPLAPLPTKQDLRQRRAGFLARFAGFHRSDTVAEFAFSMWLGHNRANPTPCVLYQLGASWGPALARGQIWRLITPVMLHANLTHLLFNVFFQLRMGFGMERQFGREKMMMIYFACGLFGNLMSVAVDPYKLAVGASTAGFGLIGVWLAEILLSWEILGPARERTVIWIVFMLISVTTMSSMTPNMDLFGHLGGALGGFLLALVISDMKEDDRPEWYHQVRAAAALALLMCLSGGLIKAFEINPKDPIPDCQIFKSLSQVMDAAAKTMGAHVASS